MIPKTLKCYLVARDSSGSVTAGVAERSTDDLPEGDVVIRVAFSSLNYKDALAASGHQGVVKRFPHVPGVDVAGTVVASYAKDFGEGDQVLVTGYDGGATRWDGWAEFVRVPHEWIVPLPDGLTLREAMILGTAGLTAALCVDSLQKHGLQSDSGPIVVTGATGGVGSVAVAILGKLGYDVAAVTGKAEAHDYLKRLGATQILAREEADDHSGRPLLSARWAGGVDAVGGNILGTLLCSLRHGGCVAACGLAGSNELPVTVYPFILRAVTLAGIDAAWCPMSLRLAAWQRLAGAWKPDNLESMAHFTTLSGLEPYIADILAGRIRGRVVVEL
ncbi:MAG: oxidoreductase [Thermoguttaceae bacterium]|jgi:putative YhdH/YhfP family quinone oxidoreductase